MPIVTLSAVHTAMALPNAVTFKDNVINPLLPIADAVIERYCKRKFRRPATPYTEYHSGTNRTKIWLKHRPIATPDDVLGVWIDQGGFWGRAPDAFSSPSNVQVDGQDYALKIDDSDGLGSEAAILVRLSAPFVLYGQNGTRWGGPMGPVWPAGQGNIKVQYYAGYTDATMPVELIQAGAQWLAWALRTGQIGPNSGDVSSESVGSYSYNLATNPAPDVGSIRNLLSNFREVVMGGVG